MKEKEYKCLNCGKKIKGEPLWAKAQDIIFPFDLILCSIKCIKEYRTIWQRKRDVCQSIISQLTKWLLK